jgi:hypothetical protein
MIIRVILISLLSTLFSGAYGQDVSKTDDYIDGTIAFATYQASIAIHYTHMWRLGKAQKFSLGLGGRLTSYLGNNQFYITAPAKITSGSTSPLIFFQDNKRENIDTLLVNTPQVTMLNVSLNIGYQLTSRFSAGFNIDAIGFSVGTRQQANYINGYTGKNTTATPTSFNLLLISDNDLGSLNSEIFARYKLNEKWAIKAGLQFLFTEYTTDTKVQTYPEENDRFRNKSFMIGLGVNLRI